MSDDGYHSDNGRVDPEKLRHLYQLTGVAGLPSLDEADVLRHQLDAAESVIRRLQDREEGLLAGLAYAGQGNRHNVLQKPFPLSSTLAFLENRIGEIEPLRQVA